MPRTANRRPTDVLETVLDQFVGPPADVAGGGEAITKNFRKALVERMPGGELTHHLGYPPGGATPPETVNHRTARAARRS